MAAEDEEDRHGGGEERDSRNEPPAAEGIGEAAQQMKTSSNILLEGIPQQIRFVGKPILHSAVQSGQLYEHLSCFALDCSFPRRRPKIRN